MSFLYPRTVSVRRPASIAGVGAVAYSGETETNESTPFFSKTFPAAIQHRSGRGGRMGDLPGDAITRSDFYIFLRSPNLGDITERDIIVDDLGKRYQVIASYWNSLGYRISATLLEV